MRARGWVVVVVATARQALIPQELRFSVAPVAQLDRAPGYEPGGREFESLRAHHNISDARTFFGLLAFDALIRTPDRQQVEFDNAAQRR